LRESAGPGIFKKKIQDFPELSRRHGNPDNCVNGGQQEIKYSI